MEEQFEEIKLYKEWGSQSSIIDTVTKWVQHAIDENLSLRYSRDKLKIHLRKLNISDERVNEINYIVDELLLYEIKDLLPRIVLQNFPFKKEVDEVNNKISNYNSLISDIKKYRRWVKELHENIQKLKEKYDSIPLDYSFKIIDEALKKIKNEDPLVKAEMIRTKKELLLKELNRQFHYGETKE